MRSIFKNSAAMAHSSGVNTIVDRVAGVFDDDAAGACDWLLFSGTDVEVNCGCFNDGAAMTLLPVLAAEAERLTRRTSLPSARRYT